MRWLGAIALLCIGVVVLCWGFRPSQPATATQDQPAQYLGTFVWTGDADWFGGFSGLTLSPDGNTFHTVTDRGHLVIGTLIRERGVLKDIVIDTENPLQHDNTLVGDTVWADAEGLAIDKDGKLYVSFEGFSRVWIYDAPDAVGRWASYSRSWRLLAKNGGLEALAINAQGHLFAFVERLSGKAKGLPVYVKVPGPEWKIAFDLPVNDRFRPVGADFGPDGRLYLLERDVYPFAFRTRVRALTLTDDGIASEKTLLETALGRHDNLEGISVWQDANGATRITMISDDNFLPYYNTDIVEYVLRP